MILIVSTNDDFSTDQVALWLLSMKVSFFRLNEMDEVKIVSLDISNDKEISIICDVIIKSSKKTIRLDFSKFGYIWYRRGDISIETEKFTSNNPETTLYDTNINKRIFEETIKIRDFIYYFYKYKKCILNNYFDNYLNKLWVLFLSKKVGLIIPDSTITGNKSTALSVVNSKKIITKAISEGTVFYKQKNISTFGYTEEVTNKEIDKKSNYFCPSLLQKKVNKEIELRIFYIDNKFFSSAIFSQNNTLTKTDFRKYDSEKPNRVVPFKLPKIIEKKLINLMALCELNSGSIDMILTTNQEYIFLEVNPIGQFHQVSLPCNYFIEREIAKYLFKKDAYGTEKIY